MSDKRKTCPNKPPVPARPKNLVVLNSKHLPKPPETFSTENGTNFIKDLNLDVKDEDNEITNERRLKSTGLVKCENASNGDAEEDTYGYLEPVSLSSISLNSDSSTSSRSTNGHVTRKKPGHLQQENLKFGNFFRKVISRNSSVLSESPEIDESKPQFGQSQWQRPLPLPPTPTKVEVTSMPWFKNIDRNKGEEILRNGVDGYFLVRPSSNADTYLTLTLWFNKRMYNIPIRKRKDGKFALGTPKSHEQSFDSIENMVKNYQSEKLILYSNGVQTGKTLLTTYPP